MTMPMRICSGYKGYDPIVRNYFFSAAANYRGILKNTDEAVLAIKWSAVVGGVLLRDRRIIYEVGSRYARKKLSEVAKKIL